MPGPENVGGIWDEDIIHGKALRQQFADQPDSTVDRDLRVFLQRYLQNAGFVEWADRHLFSPFRCGRVSVGTAPGLDSKTAVEQAIEISLDRVELGFSDGKRIRQLAFDCPEFNI